VNNEDGICFAFREARMFQTNRRAIDVVVEMPKGNHGPWLAALREIDASAEYRLVGLRYLLKDHVIYNSPSAEDYLEHGICFERRSLFSSRILYASMPVYYTQFVFVNDLDMSKYK
jgi:hypothetical protein